MLRVSVTMRPVYGKAGTSVGSLASVGFQCLKLDQLNELLKKSPFPQDVFCPPSSPSSEAQATAPQRPEPRRYVVTFPRKTVLKFEYTVVQLNRLPWRRFMRQRNPVVSALMAKMKMSTEERPRVKAECLRLLASLKLDPARTKLIGGFIDSYLRLNAEEMKRHEQAIGRFTPAERRETMEIVTSWHQAGRTEGITQGKTEGITQGKETLVLRLLRRRLSSVPTDLAARLDTLTPEQLDDLGEALLDFRTVADLQQWLDQH